ncbi:helix-turn-helix domain-containing protein [Peptoniphilus equinus]|uniref:Helix-turn-helix domain-containing protein n=1 Tax=Peptoniphilus equinus TaxID=3016343 RepID=A0ABY7QTE0_9FIRM|nr:helix-turn-helix domain-containing protein [Peptoniphilus equinus]WBW49349.1 helix-turn-helix domain-containing protein [Peptoniphilus equinus]
MNKKVNIQEPNNAIIDERRVAFLDIQTDVAPTKPLLHKEARFLFVTNGHAKIKIQNHLYTMKKGTLMALLPWQISEIVEVDEPVSYYLLVYKIDLVSTIIKQYLNINSETIEILDSLYASSAIEIPHGDMDSMNSYFVDMRNEIGIQPIDVDFERKEFSSIYLIAKITELIIYYLRHIRIQEDMDKPFQSEDIFKYMYLNSSSNLSLESLSHIFFMSESSISKYIKTVTGLGFYELLNEMRLSKAHFLLLHTNMTLETIATILNYSNPSQLSKAFSSEYGMGTKQFRLSYSQMESFTTIRYDERGAKIIEYIYDNYADDIDIADISKIFEVTPIYANKLLKYLVEKNFVNFLNFLRVNRACELLRTSDRSIADIAILVGYSSVKTFNRNFLKFYDLTPSEFRNLATDYN